MSYELLAVFALVKVLLAFGLLFVYLPAKLFPQRPDLPLVERFFENFAWMVCSTIVFVHLLALARLYSIFALFACYGAAWGLRAWHRHQHPPAPPGERRRHTLWTRVRRFVVDDVVLVLNVLDRVVNLKMMLRARLATRIEEVRRWASDGPTWVHAALFTLILAGAGAVRYADAFQAAAFGFSDPYTHLLWLKDLKAGVLYPPGNQQYYPKGYHAFLAALNGFTGVDSALGVRLAGPLVGTLLVVAVYFVGRRLTGNRAAGLVGMALFGVGIQLIHLLDSYVVKEGALAFEESSMRWLTRQTAPLSEEFALVFLMPALFWAHEYVTEGGRRRLLRTAAAALIIFMVHSLVAIALGVGLAVLLGPAVLLGRRAWPRVLAAGAAVTAAGVLGSLQIIYGFLFGVSVQQEREKYFGSWLAGFGELPYSLEILASAALGLLLLVGGVLLARNGSRRLLWSFVGLYLLVLAFLGRSLNFGILYLISPDRVTHYRVFLLAGATAGLYHAVTLFPLLRDRWARHRWTYQAITAAVVVTIVVTGLPFSTLPALLEVPRFEYDALARLSYRIKRSFPPLEWTLVSTVEDYSKVLNDGGWHINGEEFLDTYNPFQPRLDVPTRYVFLFVEREPFPMSSYGRLNEEGVRLDIERRLQEWTSIYDRFHDDMSVYYQDWNVTVYLIARPATPRGPGIPQVRPDLTPLAGRIFDQFWHFVRRLASWSERVQRKALSLA